MKFWLRNREDNVGWEKEYAYWRTLKKQRDERWAKDGSPYDAPNKDNASAPSLKQRAQ